MGLFGIPSRYDLFKRDWINNQCKKEDKHFVIPGTFSCSLCGKRAIKLKGGGYRWKEVDQN
jgi:hypothetical protein